VTAIVLACSEQLVILLPCSTPNRDDHPQHPSEVRFMPIDYRIDHERRLVLATAHDAITEDDLMGYQQTAWSDPAVAGYGELVDMSTVLDIETPSVSGIRRLAALSTRMDAAQGESRFAIVAPGDLAFGLARMYQVYRELEGGGRKQVCVFRTREDALAWLSGGVPEAGGSGNEVR
jgi:hypothetical protein